MKIGKCIVAILRSNPYRYLQMLKTDFCKLKKNRIFAN